MNGWSPNLLSRMRLRRLFRPIIHSSTRPSILSFPAVKSPIAISAPAAYQVRNAVCIETRAGTAVAAPGDSRTCQLTPTAALIATPARTCRLGVPQAFGAPSRGHGARKRMTLVIAGTLCPRAWRFVMKFLSKPIHVGAVVVSAVLSLCAGIAAAQVTDGPPQRLIVKWRGPVGLAAQSTDTARAVTDA